MDKLCGAQWGLICPKNEKRNKYKQSRFEEVESKRSDSWEVINLARNYYRVCPYCGAVLDPGEECDCEASRRESA